MAATEDEAPEGEKKKKGGLWIVIGLGLAVLGAGGGFVAVYSGLLFGGPVTEQADAPAPRAADQMPDVAFIPIEPLLIGFGSSGRHLRFRAQLEVPGPARAEVEALIPRVIDVMNTYLRALDASDLEDPSALVWLRAQLLRRVQVVAGKGRVNDVLVMEFVMS